MKKSATGIYHSPLLHFPGIVHGFSTKTFGDMTDTKKRNIFLSALGIEEESLVWQEQIHGDTIHRIINSDRGKTVRGVDGMVYKKSSGDNSVVLSVHTADCVPLLALDPMIRIIGSCHAGWKGTILHIGKELISGMEKRGAKAQNIRVIIGPRIGGCCYEISSIRAAAFQDEFPESDVILEKGSKLFSDIGKANYLDLVACGIQPKNIDYDLSLCTFYQKDDFYSFRRSGKKIDGEIMGVIGFE